MRRVATIGVYGFTARAFIDALRRADVRVLLDVRQRRGVRGSDYSWANSRRLQDMLSEAGIEYRHHKELAPTTELRQLQYREDERDPEACHRSLIAERLAAEHGVSVTHLTPAGLS